MSLDWHLLHGTFEPILGFAAPNFPRGRKKGPLRKGRFTGESLKSLDSTRFSRISRRWSDSSEFFRVWGFSRISRISKLSRISRKTTFLKSPLFQMTPFSEPDSIEHQHKNGTHSTSFCKTRGAHTDLRRCLGKGRSPRQKQGLFSPRALKILSNGNERKIAQKKCKESVTRKKQGLEAHIP